MIPFQKFLKKMWNLECWRGGVHLLAVTWLPCQDYLPAPLSNGQTSRATNSQGWKITSITDALRMHPITPMWADQPALTTEAELAAASSFESSQLNRPRPSPTCNWRGEAGGLERAHSPGNRAATLCRLTLHIAVTEGICITEAMNRLLRAL